APHHLQDQHIGRHWLAHAHRPRDDRGRRVDEPAAAARSDHEPSLGPLTSFVEPIMTVSTRIRACAVVATLVAVAACDDKQKAQVPTAPISVAPDAVSAYVAASNTNP